MNLYTTAGSYTLKNSLYIHLQGYQFLRLSDNLCALVNSECILGGAPRWFPRDVSYRLVVVPPVPVTLYNKAYSLTNNAPPTSSAAALVKMPALCKQPYTQ